MQSSSEVCEIINMNREQLLGQRISKCCFAYGVFSGLLLLLLLITQSVALHFSRRTILLLFFFVVNCCMFGMALISVKLCGFERKWKFSCSKFSFLLWRWILLAEMSRAQFGYLLAINCLKWARSSELWKKIVIKNNLVSRNS